MSLQIRRGTNSSRLSANPPLGLGEIAYTTDTKQIYVGNGIDQGGEPIIRLGTGLAWADAQCTTIIATGAALQVSADTNPSLGGDLNTDGHNISGTGNISTTAGSLNTAYLTLTASLITSTAPAPTTIDYIVNSPVQFGVNAIPATLIVKSSQTFGEFTGITNGTNSSGLVAKISRNTLAAPAILQPGDPMWYQQAMGYDGTSYQVAGVYGLIVDPAALVTTGHVPGAFAAITISATGSQNTLIFDSAGVLNAPVLQTGNTYTTSPDTRPALPSKGMIIFETTTNTFQGWNGSAWVVLG
jgi:hypothetical protein